MKKQFLLLVGTVFTATTMFAQQTTIPNAGFETWTDSINPTNWTTLASSNPQYATLAAPLATKEDSVFIEGSYSIKLSTVDITGVGVVPGAVWLGGADQSGIAFSGTPDTLSFLFNYAPSSTADTAFVDVYLHTDSGWLNVEFPLTSTSGQWRQYYTALTSAWAQYGAPDSLFISVTSGIDTTTAGSVLYLDDFKPYGNAIVTGITAVNKDLNSIKMFPNPASSVVTVEIPAELDAQNITVVDMAGRAVKTVNNVAGKATVNVDGLNSGNYLVTFTNAANKSFTGSKTLQVKK